MFLSFKSGTRTHARNEQKQRQKQGRMSLGSVPSAADRKENEYPNSEFGQPVWSSRPHDPFASSPLTHGRISPRPSTSSGIPSSHTRQAQRRGMFTAASDALGLRLGLVRRKDSAPKHSPEPAVLPDVVRIAARQREEEEEERNRLRVEAAQAIGLVDMEVQSYNDEEDEETLTSPGDAHGPSESVHSTNGVRNSMFTPQTAFPQSHGSSTSASISCPVTVGRYRPGSSGLGGGGGDHSRSSSASSMPVPTYPTTVSSLTQWQQLHSMIPKYYPPSSLRILTLSNSKSWKVRYIMLTSPTEIITRAKTPAVSYLHLFKDSRPDEKELERLVINEDSIVSVPDDEVGRRRHVIKVEGVEGSTYNEELNVEESSRIMWFLQIEEHAESQRWISGIRNTILNQRALRASLMSVTGTNLGINDLRGDIDVMLSMRAQGRLSSSTRQHRRTTPLTAPTVVHVEPKFLSPSEHPLDLKAPAPKAITVSAVSTLKDLFSGSRSRSAPRTASVDTPRVSSQHHPIQQGVSLDSGGGRTNSNLNGVRQFATSNAQFQSSGATTTTTSSILRPSSTVFIPSVAPGVGLDQHIIDEKEEQEGQSSLSNANTPPVIPGSPISSGNTRATKALSLGSISLQPPPRSKRWTSTAAIRPPSPASSLTSPTIGPQSEPTSVEIYKNVQLNNTTGSLGALCYSHHDKDTELGSEPGSPATNSMMNGSMDSHHVRYRSLQSPSTQSVSTYSAATPIGGDTLLLSGTQPIGLGQGMRRWSRQGQGSLLPITSPPAGPPPNPPSNAQSSSPSHSVFGGGVDRTNSCASSAISSPSRQSVVSSLPSFLKRTSVSSVGTTSTSTSHSGNCHGHSAGYVARGLKSHRSSMPPPRPAPTSALPPAPEEQDLQQLSYNPPRNQNLIPRVLHGRSRPRSVDSSVPSLIQAKRGFITGRRLGLSVNTHSKPSPSSSLPLRPDELGEVNELPLLSTSFSGPSGLPRLIPISASPDHNSSPLVEVGCSSALFPPPSSPLPPTPSSADDDNTNSANAVSGYTLLRQRSRIHSAPSPSSPSTSQDAGTDVSDAGGVRATSVQVLRAISNMTSTIPSNNLLSQPIPSHHLQIRSSHTAQLSPPRFRHSFSTGSSYDSRHRHHHLVQSPSSSSPPATVPHSPPSPSYAILSSSDDGDFSRQPPIIGEKIISMQDEASFLNLVSDTPISPTFPSSPSFSVGSLSSMTIGQGASGVGMPIQPAVSTFEMTSLSPPPRKNSKPMAVVAEHRHHPTAAGLTTSSSPHTSTTSIPTTTKPCPPRTPSNPSIFEDIFGVEARKNEAIERTSSPLPILHCRDRTFGPSDSPLSFQDREDIKETQKPSVSLSLPPSPSPSPSPPPSP